MSRAQLQALTLPILDARPETWFEGYLPQLLADNRDLARSCGGRYGFIVGARQWIVDLDDARVEGDTLSARVDESDPLDAVICVEPHALEMVLRGSHGKTESLMIAHGGRTELARLERFLAQCELRAP